GAPPRRGQGGPARPARPRPRGLRPPPAHPPRPRASGPWLARWRGGQLGLRPLPFLDEPGLLHTDLEVVPGHDFVERAGPARVEGGIALPAAEGAPPVAAVLGGELDEVGHAAVAASEEGLEPPLAATLGA